MARGCVRQAMLSFVIALDRECDKGLRQQSGQGYRSTHTVTVSAGRKKAGWLYVQGYTPVGYRRWWPLFSPVQCTP